jgi:hypothetical protein
LNGEIEKREGMKGVEGSGRYSDAIFEFLEGFYWGYGWSVRAGAN